ncbi:MAG: hypothetical protein K9J13_07615 [Saprospiraceae bacterium]|nr:hypothetical protein [Saprospiraceae bacterium]
MKNFPIIVIRSNDVCFLGVLRSCGEAGIPVVPVIFEWEGSGPWYSQFSRYYNDPREIPNPYTDENGAVESLLEIGEQLYAEFGRKLLIMPSSDTSLMFLQNNFSSLSDYFLQMGSENFDEPRLDVINKDGLYKMLEDNDIMIPQSLPCYSVADIPGILDTVKFPCLYKPLEKDYGQTFYRVHNKLKAVECQDTKELENSLLKEMKAGFKLIVQEKIEFERLEDESSCHVYVDKEGEVRIASTSNKEGEYPPRYGSGTLSLLTWRPELVEKSKEIARLIKWHGMMGIEFMKDKTDQKWKVIEINFRPWLHVYMQNRMGMPHLQMLYRDAYEELGNEYFFPSLDVISSKPVTVNLQHYLNIYNISKSGSDLLEDIKVKTEGKKLLYEFVNDIDALPGEEMLKDLRKMANYDQIIPLFFEGKKGVNLKNEKGKDIDMLNGKTILVTGET